MAAAALYTDTLIGPDSCMGFAPRAILGAHGVDDTTISIDATPNIARWTGRWAERNGCDPREDKSITELTWGNLTTYSCEGAVDSIQQYWVADLGHCWPSIVNNTDSQEHKDGSCLTHTLDYTGAALEFFAMWQKVE